MASLRAVKRYGAIPLRNIKSIANEGEKTLQTVYKRMDQATNFLERRRIEAQVFVDTLSLILSFAIFFPLGRITNEFDGNCLLYSNISLQMDHNDVVSIDLTKTKYHNGDQCEYTTYINAVVAIHSIVWIWFFFHLEPLKRKNGSILNLLLPALLCRFIFLICVLVSSIKISSGTSKWCENIRNNMKIAGYDNYSCSKLQDLTWERSRSTFYTFSLVAIICTWLLVVNLMLACALTVLHIYNDFVYTMRPELEAIEDRKRQKEDYDPIEGDVAAGGFVNEGADKNDFPVDPSQVVVNADLHNVEEDREFELANDDSRVRNRSRRGN